MLLVARGEMQGFEYVLDVLVNVFDAQVWLWDLFYQGLQELTTSDVNSTVLLCIYLLRSKVSHNNLKYNF